MDHSDLQNLKLELSLKAKNGIDFISSASIIWIGITYIWMMPFSAYNLSVFTFMIGGLMFPLAILMSIVWKTNWKIKGNPLQSLGIWLNFAQLFYFPFLVFVLIKSPDYFVMTYAIITGAHFFPYAWFYNEKAFAVMGGIISVGALMLALYVSPGRMYLVPMFMVVSLVILAIWIHLSYKCKRNIKQGTGE